MNERFDDFDPVQRPRVLESPPSRMRWSRRRYFYSFEQICASCILWRVCSFYWGRPLLSAKR